MFCFRCTILYYSIGAETSAPPAIFKFTPEAPVHGLRVSRKNGRQIKILNTRWIWPTVSVFKKTEFVLMPSHNFYRSANIGYFHDFLYELQNCTNRIEIFHPLLSLWLYAYIWRTVPFLRSPRSVEDIHRSFTDRRKVLIFRRCG